MARERNTYPGVEQIENRGLQLTIRQMWDAIYSLQDAINNPAPTSISSEDISKVRTALQAGGSDPLRLDRLQGRVDLPPETGGWSLSNTLVGNGIYVWDLEDISQADLFTLDRNEGSVKILAAGKYQVNAHVTARLTGAGVGKVYINKNGSAVYSAEINTGVASQNHTFALVKKFILAGGDSINVELISGDRRRGDNDVPGGSSMEITRLAGWEVPGG